MHRMYTYMQDFQNILQICMIHFLYPKGDSKKNYSQYDIPLE